VSSQVTYTGSRIMSVLQVDMWLSLMLSSFCKLCITHTFLPSTQITTSKHVEIHCKVCGLRCCRHTPCTRHCASNLRFCTCEESRVRSQTSAKKEHPCILFFKSSDMHAGQVGTRLDSHDFDWVSGDAQLRFNGLWATISSISINDAFAGSA